jgi:predicted nucleic acid-binding protein
MNQKTFWPSVYKVNVNRYPELIKEFGNANNVMKAEKKAIWDALHYDDECKLIAVRDGSKCRGKLEDRHRGKDLPKTFTKKSAFKVCKYKTNGHCVGANVKLDQSLQFLRWLLYSVDPNAFRAYVHSFPHQLTERNYGYNIEENEQYIPEPVVQELQAVYINADLQELPNAIQYNIEQASAPVRYAERLSSVSPLVKRGQRAVLRRVSIKRSDENRLKECVANSKRLEEKLKEHALEAKLLSETLNENKRLRRELLETSKSLANVKADRDDLNRAYMEAEKYAQDCQKARTELKEMRREMEKLANQRAPSEADLKRAFDIMTKKIGITMTRAAETGSQAFVTVAKDVKANFVRIQRIMQDKDTPTSERAAELIKFYIELFDTETGYLSEVL